MIDLGEIDGCVGEHNALVLASKEDLITAAFADPHLAALVRTADWYLVGSRACGFADDRSDWDTILLTRDDPDGDVRAITSRARLDNIFGVIPPRDETMGTLSHHIAWRRSGAIDLDILGPTGRAHRPGIDDVIWAHDLRHAIALHLGAGMGETYRRVVDEAFTTRWPAARDDAYQGFRMSRNATAATFIRDDELPRAITSGRCARQAIRFWLLSSGDPYPADKWLSAALRADPTATALLPLLDTVTTSTADPATRFEALWSLWRVIDARAMQAGVDLALMAGSPFIDSP